MTMKFRTLINIAELQALQAAQADLLLIDVGFDLTDTTAGEKAFAAGHLPGAGYLHLEQQLSGDKTDAQGRFKGRHPLPDRDAFAQHLSELGLQADSQVVVYDAQGSMYAARLWWMLNWVGHEAVAVLNGGRQAWIEAGGALTQQPHAPRSASGFLARKSSVASLSAEELLARIGRMRLIDARAAERFRGEVEPLDAKAGHIPGASNRFFKDNLQADGSFKPAAMLHAEFSALLAPFTPEQVVHQCGSGVTACHNLLAMTHAGLMGSLLYPGSWSEWSSDPDRPIAQG
jgi:thiosulfate/3-mercaptopyruvate sulfurtransferase